MSKKKKTRRVNKQKRASPVPDTGEPVDKRYINKQQRKINASTITREVGQPGVITSDYFIQDSRKTELLMPRRFYTFDVMCQDDAVSNSVNFTNMLVVNALHGGEVVAGISKSKKSETAADAINYMIRNMSYGTWLDTCMNAVTDLKYGFSFLNIVTEKAKIGKYKGSNIIKKLAPRDQKSVYGWVWDNKLRDFKGFVQKANLVQNKTKIKTSAWLGNINALNAGRYNELGYPYLKREQLLHFTYNATNNNPQGNSPLMDCYNAWAEKKLIEKFELSAITKGLGGVLLLKLPSELIEKANDPDGRYPEAAAEYIALQEDAAAIHSAENALMVMMSDVDEVTKQPLYDVKFMGVEGGTATNSFDTTKIIDQKRKAIYNTFLTSAILLGQEGGGSYALSTNMTSMHGLAVENNIIQKVNVINTQLIPRLLEINDIELDWKDMPQFQPADPNEIDLAVVASAIQKMKAVGGITKEAITHLYGKLGWPVEGIDALVFDDGNTSRSGDGFQTAGEGTSNSVGDKNGGNASDSNLANKSASQEKMKEFVEDGKWIVDTETDTPLDNVILGGDN